MPAMDALHVRTIYREDLMVNHRMAEYLGSYIETSAGAPAVSDRANEMGVAVPVTSPNSWQAGMSQEEMRLRLIKWLEAADTYYVDPRMHALVTAAAESMPQEELLPRDIPSDFGFLMIPGGLGVIDIRGKALKYHAVQWASFGGAVYITWLTDKYDMTDSTNLVMRAKISTEVFREFPQFAPGGFNEMRFGHPLPVSVGPDFLVPPERELRVIHNVNEDGSRSIAWAFDKGYTPDELLDKMSMSVRTDPALRWLLATWRLMQQSVTSVTEEHAPRNMRRALERKNQNAKVTVISLRHRVSQGDGGNEVEWSHRWLVKGHWRNQPCKEDGEWTTRLVWIHPYVKGPEDKPLLIREHVYALVR